MRNIVRVLKQLLGKKDDGLWLFTGENKYDFQFRISFPIGGGSYRETGSINVTIPANSKVEAKNKLKEFVLQKVQVTVVNIEESE